MKIKDLLEDEEKVAGPLSSFAAGWKNAGRTSASKPKLSSTNNNPLDSFNERELKIILKKVIEEQPLDDKERLIVKQLYKKV